MKRPTIKGTNRAYVRLYDYVVKRDAWDEFTQKYSVRMIPHGMEKNGDCAVHVLDQNGRLACLGAHIPHKITYSDFIHPPRTTWVEFFSDDNASWKKVIST